MLLPDSIDPKHDQSDPQPPGSWQDQPSTHPDIHGPWRASRRPRRGRYQPRHPSYRLSRDELRRIAEITLNTLEAGSYIPPGSRHPYDLASKIQYTNEHTGYYPPDDPDLEGWASADLGDVKKETKIIIGEYSTLVGARKLHAMVEVDREVENKTIGVLNFASAKKPGGGFINGAQAQEESIARASTLYPSLVMPIAQQFYQLYADDPDNAFYTHAMVYSPSVVLIRNDKGEWKTPIDVDVLTSAAVNAGDVRKQVEWEEEMRQLRQRVRLAEAARAKEEDRRRKEEEEERQRWEAEEEDEKKRMAQEQRGREESTEVEKQESERKEGADEKKALAQEEEEDKRQSNTSEFKTLIQTNPTDESPAQSPTGPLTFASFPSYPPVSSETPSSASSSPSPPPNPLALAELDIEAEMQERIARVLFLFHRRGAQHLVLGSFGTGVFQNRVELVAGVFRDLLSEGGKFHGAFDRVVFAILDGATVKTFRAVFGDAASVDDEGEGSDVDGRKDAPDAPDAVDGKVDTEKAEKKIDTVQEKVDKVEEKAEESTETAEEREEHKLDEKLDKVIEDFDKTLDEPPTSSPSIAELEAPHLPNPAPI